MSRITWVALCFFAVWAGPSLAAEDTSFDRTIAPLLARRCLDCHRGEQPEGGLDLSRRDKALAGGESGVALVAGEVEDSLLWQRVASDDMPPKKPLTDDERELLKQWIASGAKWGTEVIDPFRFTTESRAGYDWWSLQAVVRPAAPVISDEYPRHNAIDAFIQHKLQQQGLAPAPPADERTLVRRLSLDVLGLPPTPEEVEAFLADTRPDAYDRLVERVLASPHYGERWARHWLDVARFGESQGFERDKLRTNSWPYRDWLIRAFNDDLPYRDFVIQQIAGDVLPSATAGTTAASGFLVAGPFDEVGKSQQSAAMKAVVRQDELEDFVGVVGQTFLGLTTNCARCHDHKFDPIAQREYYQLAAALAGVEHGERPVQEMQRKPQADVHIAALAARQRHLRETWAQREAAIRARLLAQRQAPQGPVPPRPLAEWTFDDNADDKVGQLHAKLWGEAKLTDGRLRLDGKTAYAASAVLEKDLGEKTLVAWVQLADVKQAGGGVLGVQTLDGSEFDAIVFGEREPLRWMAGSEFFRRYQPLTGGDETAADRELVCIALTYAADGTIAAYRNGQPYGKPYSAGGLKTFPAGKAQVVFGLRHGPPGGNKMLAGAIDRVMLFDRALKAEEVAALAGAGDVISEQDVLAELTADQRAERAAAQFELSQLQDQVKRWQENKVYAVAPRSPHAVHVLARGEPNKPREEVVPGGVAALAGVESDFRLPGNSSDAERRLALARWITDERNPLTPRVLVNRLWHYHFGVGLVETPNDFGFNGGRPSHPELLDWLASELVASGGSVKHVQRLIVTSATYRQQSRPQAAALAKDADNRLLWRKSPARLDAETLRDAMLAASGQLNTEMFGPGYQDFTTYVHNSQFYTVLDAAGETFHRRSLYRTWIRSGRLALLDAFDCPDPSTKTPSRAVTTTPLQALSLLNNPFVFRMSAATAQRFENVSPERTLQISALYQALFSRRPSPEELADTTAFANEHGLPALVRVLLNSNEFLYVD